MPTQQQIDDAIATLSQVKPPYLKTYEDFVPGKDFVQYSGQWWDENEMKAALDTFIKGKWITSGEQVAAFQDAFAKKYNTKYAHMVNSGSSANLVMITALKKHLGWQDGDEVIVSPVGFPTTIAPLVQNNLVPVFVDIELNTLNFDVDFIESKITDRTRAIFVSPVLGNPPDMKYLQSICWEHNIELIGDNCDSLGTTIDGTSITDYYYSWSCSFYPAHHISTGEGGMVCSNDEELIKTARSISWWGRDCYCVGSSNTLSCGTCGKRFDYWLNDYDGIVDHKYVFTNMGYNLKPLDLQGAIGLEQLKKVDQIDILRNQYKNRLDKALKKKEGFTTINTLPGVVPSWFGTPVFCETPELKEFFVAHLEANHIQTRNYFSGNILLHPGYKHLDDHKKYPYANLALSNVFFLGCSPLWTEEVLQYIEKVIEEF